MNLFVKILTIVLWVVVICALVFTAFRFQWFAAEGTWLVKYTFDYNMTYDEFYTSMIISCLWLILIMSLMTIIEYAVFLYKLKHPKDETEVAESKELLSSKEEAKKKRFTLISNAIESVKNKMAEKVAEKITEAGDKAIQTVDKPKNSAVLKKENTTVSDNDVTAKVRNLYR